MDDRISVRSSSDVDIAEAHLTAANERLIFYNVVRLQELKAMTKDYWSMIAVLAHELGHHLRLHTVIPGRDHEFEIEADYYAGYALRRMGSTLEQAQSAFRTIGTEDATPTHPSRKERIAAVTRGWLEADVQVPVGSISPQPVPSTPPAPTPPPAAPSANPPKPSGPSASGRQIRDCPLCPELVVIDAGDFTMGSTELEDEKPLRAVSIRRPFAIGKFEVTFDEWQSCADGGGCANNRVPGDQGWGRGRRPAVNVSWFDAIDYVAWLSRRTGKTYRLPSEAEWEYAARAGTTTRYAFGNAISPSQAQFSEGAWGRAGRTVEVGTFQANAWGLHDMHGNVWEWCEDAWHPNYAGAPGDGTVWTGGDASMRVLRGGAWSSPSATSLRSAVRFKQLPTIRSNSIGFRVVRAM